MKRTILLLVIVYMGCVINSDVKAQKQNQLEAQPTEATVRSQGPTETVPFFFYRLRVELSTTSDWTMLELGDTTDILTIRPMITEGNPSNISTQVARLVLNQSPDAAMQGNRVSITVDYSCTLDLLNYPLKFTLRKGAINRSDVRIFSVSGDQPQLIQEINRNVPNDYPIEFSLDLSRLREIPPNRIDQIPVRKMIWAVYYTWYAVQSWESPLLKDHPKTRYASSDPNAILRHIEQAQSAGIDGFISSWWGPDDYTDRNLRILLDLAQARNFSVSIYFETLRGNGTPRNAEEIFNWLAYAISNYRDHPAFMKVGGKPFIAIWAADQVPLKTWKDIFARLKSQGLEAVFLATPPDLNFLEVFDGLDWYAYFNNLGIGLGYAILGHEIRYYSLLADLSLQKNLTIWAATAMPGSDDTLIPGRMHPPPYPLERENGVSYRTQFEAAIRSNPHWIFITSWNEWYENTHIEPSELYDDQYLKITREFVDRWRTSVYRNSFRRPPMRPRRAPIRQ